MSGNTVVTAVTLVIGETGSKPVNLSHSAGTARAAHGAPPTEYAKKWPAQTCGAEHPCSIKLRALTQDHPFGPSSVGGEPLLKSMQSHSAWPQSSLTTATVVSFKCPYATPPGCIRDCYGKGGRRAGGRRGGGLPTYPEAKLPTHPQPELIFFSRAQNSLRPISGYTLGWLLTRPPIDPSPNPGCVL